MHATALVAAAASLLLAAPAHAMYSKSSPVLQLDGKSYNRLIAQSNHTSIVEFYAPWCGHCQNLKPAYEKAATNLKGLAKVAAVNCDEEINKPFCGTMGVQGFPTLKIVRPGKKPGKPAVEDYQGARTAKGIVDAVLDKIPNHVTRVTDTNLEDWLKEANETSKAILFTEKGKTGALLKALAVEFLGSVRFAQIRDKDTDGVSAFGITEYPMLILLPGGDKEGLVYTGEFKKDAMVEFISQVAAPNPDPAPASAKPKKAKKEDKKKSSSASSSFAKASASHASEDASSIKLQATSISIESAGQPTESPDPIVDSPPPVAINNDPATIPELEDEASLEKACLGVKSGTCILAFLPSKKDPDALLPENAIAVLKALGEILQKHQKRQGHLFPFYSIPATNPSAAKIRDALSLKADGEIELIATNAKRAWWKQYAEDGFSRVGIETWIDYIRMGEGKKGKLPESLIAAKQEEAPPAEAPAPEPEQEPIKTEVDEVLEAPEPEPVKAQSTVRDEL